MNIFRKRPWLLVIVAFLILIGAWTTLIVVTSKNKVEVIEVPTAPAH